MNILVVTDLYPVRDDEKSTPRTIYDFVRGWKELGHNVFVIKPNFILNSFLRGKPFYKQGLYDDVLNLNFWTPFWGNVKSKIPKTKFSLPQIDAVIAHMPSGLIFANKINFGVPLVAGVHVSDLEVLTNPLYSVYFKRELEKAYENAAKIACRSEILQKKFLKLYPQYESKTFVAYSGINPDYITEKGWEKKDVYKILTCANLIKRKNADKVIEACETIPDVELTIIGDGKELKRLKKISHKPLFLGRIEHSKVLEEMKKSDIFVLPSENETFGMVYLEAMASGCVTVGLRGDGIDGIIRDGFNGYLTGINDVRDTLLRIINTDNSNILKNSHDTVLNLTRQKACENYLNNILQALPS